MSHPLVPPNCPYFHEYSNGWAFNTSEFGTSIQLSDAVLNPYWSTVIRGVAQDAWLRCEPTDELAEKSGPKPFCYEPGWWCGFRKGVAEDWKNWGIK